MCIGGYDWVKMPYHYVLIPEDVGFSAAVLEWPGCFSQGDTAEEAVANLRNAMLSWVEASYEAKHAIPFPHEHTGVKEAISNRKAD